MAKIPIILEAGRADGKLVTTNAIFDKNKSMFQSEINDIQDTLTSDNSNKPLSAKQGKVLKELLDAKVIEVGAVPVDSEPIEGNITHVVNSDGLAKEFNKCNTKIIQGGIYDVSSHNNGAVFESLSALLNNANLSTLIPASVRHGGMSIRFIQSSENKYVQFRYMGTNIANADFVNVANWQGVDTTITPDSKDLVKSGNVFNVLDASNRNIGDVTGEYKFEGIYASTVYGVSYVHKYVQCSNYEQFTLKVVAASVNGASIAENSINLRIVANTGSTYSIGNVSLDEEFEFNVGANNMKGFCINISSSNVLSNGYLTFIIKRVDGSLLDYIERSSVMYARFIGEKVPSITRTDNLRFSITFQDTTANIYDFGMSYYSFTLNEVTSFDVASYEGVYLNTYNNTLFKATIGAGNTLSKAAILLFGVYNNTPFGILANYYFSERVRTLESSVSDIRDDVSDINNDLAPLTSKVPDYYVSNVNQAVAKIKENMAAVGKNGESFIFISDIHWEANNQNSPKLIKDILKKTNVKDILCTGDLINEGEKATMATELIECTKAFEFDAHPLITTRGNHDDNSNWGTQEQITEHEFNFNEYYSYFLKPMEGKITYIGTDASFYYDKKETKTRYIFLDSRRNGTVGGGTGAIPNAVNLLNATETGWKVVFIQHFPTGLGMDAIKAMVDGCNDRSSAKVIPAYSITADFSKAKCECVAIFAGHAHKDQSYTTDGGVPIIVIDTDCGSRTEQSDYPYVAGTVTEQCFDVVTMDYVNKTIKCVRVGRGIDRNFTY